MSKGRKQRERQKLDPVPCLGSIELRRWKSEPSEHNLCAYEEHAYMIINIMQTEFLSTCFSINQIILIRCKQQLSGNVGALIHCLAIVSPCGENILHRSDRQYEDKNISNYHTKLFKTVPDQTLSLHKECETFRTVKLKQ